MALTEVQDVRNSGTSATASATITSATANNLIVIRLNSDSTATLPSGYSAGPSAVDFVGTYIFYKIAAGGETSVSITLGGSTTWTVQVVEYSGNVTVSPLDASGSQTPGVTSTVTITTSGNVSTTDSTALAAVGVFNADLTHSWSNSFTADYDSGTTNELATSFRDNPPSGATLTTTDTLSLSNDRPCGVLAVFKATAVTAVAPVRSAQPGKTWQRRFHHREWLPQAPIVTADVRSDTALGAVGLEADVTAKKVAVVTAISSLGLSATPIAKKVSKSTGIGTAGLTSTATAKKVSTPTASGNVGLSANFVHADIRSVTVLATLGFTSTSTAKKITPATVPAPVGLTGISTVKKVSRPTLSASIGLAGIVTAQKKVIATGLGALGLQAMHSGVSPRFITVIGPLGFTSTLAAKKRATPISAGVLGLSGNVLPKKISKSTGIGAVGLEPLATIRKKQAVSAQSLLGLASWWDHLTALANALSFPTVIGRNSTPTVTGATTSTAAMSARASSTPSVSDG